MRFGKENDGWRIAQAPLTAERGPAILELAERLSIALGWLDELARGYVINGGAGITDPAIREQLVTLETEVLILRRLCRQVVASIARGGGSGPEASIIKVFYSEL